MNGQERTIPPARQLVIHLEVGAERLWCDACLRQSRVRVYAFSEQSVGVICTVCAVCGDRRKEQT